MQVKMQAKRIICAMLTLCLALMWVPALALTGDEALGLSGGGSAQSADASYPTLQRGSKDEDDAGAYVVMLQNRLIELGYLSATADGTYGSQTESAVINFQIENGLTPSGIADNTTQSVLYASSVQRAQTQMTADNDVLRVQQCLTRWGFMMGTPDGIAGENTANGIKAFKDYLATNSLYQQYATPTPAPSATPAPDEQPVAIDQPLYPGFSIDMEAGEITDQVLKFVDGEYPFQIYQMTVQTGSEGPEVWRVQRRLSQLKYLYKPDGSYGSLTDLAVKYFQRKNGLPESGVADQATQEKLFSSEALQSEEYVFPYKIGVDLSAQRVHVYAWQGSGYTKEFASCKCSSGQRGFETPRGTYQSGGRCTVGEWYYFKQYNEYAKYATRIVGGVLFHSVLYKKKGGRPTNSSVRNLGRAVSHGCVRLPEGAAKWIFDNCPEGTTIVIY